jgi:hypothetical protein
MLERREKYRNILYLTIPCSTVAPESTVLLKKYQHDTTGKASRQNAQNKFVNTQQFVMLPPCSKGSH